MTHITSTKKNNTVAAAEMLRVRTPKEWESSVGGNALVLVKFYADWCGSCHVLASTMSLMHAFFESMGLKVVCVNVDDDVFSTLAPLGVDSVPTLSLFRGGVEVLRMDDSLSEYNIRTKLMRAIGGSVPQNPV